MHLLLLTQEHCTFCLQAKALLLQLGAEYGFTISTLDVGTPEGGALAMKHGILFPPGIFIDGEPICYGRPSARKLRKELQRRQSAQEGRQL